MKLVKIYKNIFQVYKIPINNVVHLLWVIAFVLAFLILIFVVLILAGCIEPTEEHIWLR